MPPRPISPTSWYLPSSRPEIGGRSVEAEATAQQNLARTMNQHLKALAEKDYRNAVATDSRNSGRGNEITRILSVMYLPNEGTLEKLQSVKL